ncbi:fibrous sheath-interacting protein 1 isoform X4 [Caretta caretta]|uniref:fibrous sheath-interacting protein 1 isoform X4 n=1 Tax=Caretta caretta TaxID=8467 RepID=UPI003F4C3385
MDITRGNLDEISRPASSSRAHPVSRALSASLEVLTPEPGLSKVSSPVERKEDNSRNSSVEENKDDDSEKHEVKKMRTSPQTSEREINCIFQQKIQNANECPDPSHSEEDEIFISVFHTQINSEDYDCNEKQAVQDHLNEIKTSGSLKITGKTDQKSDTRSKNTQDFIKKNIELAKDSGSQLVMLTEEKKRLVELLKDIEDNGSELQGIEEDVTGWLIPGEGYTPEPMEYHHLNEIDAKLQVVLSNGDFCASHSSCSKVPSQIYQESLAYANRSLEAVPGEKVLQDAREQREQQNRLKEINQQLKNLDGNLNFLQFVHIFPEVWCTELDVVFQPEEVPCLSEGQLVTLLEECMQFPRTTSNVTMPELQESLSDGISPFCYTTQDSTLLSRSTLSKLLDEARSVGMLSAQEGAGIEDKSICESAESETCGYYLSKALAISHLSKDSVAQIEEPDDLESSQEMENKSNTEGYFMSRALSAKRLKKPSFLDEPFYCISMNNELSTEADIPSIPLQTRGDDLKIEDVTAE